MFLECVFKNILDNEASFFTVILKNICYPASRRVITQIYGEDRGEVLTLFCQ